MQDGTGKTVFVGLSGGVDSSVAAARLQARGFTVVGVFIKVWHPEWMKCNWEQERLDAMRVAAHLGIPFLTCNAETAYRDDVAHYFIEEYKAGRTPNPDVMCNKYVKFGRFLDFAKEKGADYIATGHYAQRIEGRGSDMGGAELHRGVDENKDQTYFLWSLSREQLSAALFPVGDTPKEHIRQEAAKLNIPVAQKKDSQGICFLGHVDIKEFLSHYVELVPGDVLSEAGEVIGKHDGALIYTTGQRHGFTLSTTDAARTPHFVTSKDIHHNTITVAATQPTQEQSSILGLHNTVLRQPLTVGDSLELQIRYRQTPIVATVTEIDESTLVVTPSAAIDSPASGQSCVLYRGPHCLGGGIVS